MSIMIVEDDYVLAKDLQSIVEAARHRSVGPLQRMEQALAYAATADIALVALKLADGPTRASIGAQAHRHVPTGGHLCNRGRKV